MRDVTKLETRSRFAMLWPPAWKVNLTSQLCHLSSNSDKIR